MDFKKLKIIKRKIDDNFTYLPFIMENPIQCIGNFDPDKKYLINIPSKWYLTFEEIHKKEARRKYYKKLID